MSAQKESLLGDWSPVRRPFLQTESIVSEFKKKEFASLPDRKKSDQVNRALLKLIQEEKPPCFLLPAVLDFVEKIDRENILAHYIFSSFEVWLNHVSGLTETEQLMVRGKIAGKFVDRSEYQNLFPIAMGKKYEGTHFVTAHKSPDLDTTVASFWGWVDAFAARVGTGLHLWNLPGGAPVSQIEIQWLFVDVFGKAVLSHLPKTRSALTLTGNDLMTQEGFLKKPLSESLASIDHERSDTAIVVVDQGGFYLGDWRSMDVEGVRQVIILLSSLLRWFENNLHLQLISMLAKENLMFQDVAPFLQGLFGMKLEECEPALEFSTKQKKQVELFLSHVLGLPLGLKVDFQTLGITLARLSEVPFDSVEKLSASMRPLFDERGKIFEKRPQIFSFLEKAIRNLHHAIFTIRQRLERLDIAMKTKEKVFDRKLNYVTVQADIEEIEAKMKNYPYLTVTYPDKDLLFPVGIIQAPSLRKQILGTVSLRDFCNRDEMGIPAYLDVISVIDHHKSELHTFSPPLAIIADVQSSNSLVAKEAFNINDRYSVGGQTVAQIDADIRFQSQQNSSSSMKLLERLFKRKMAAERSDGFFVDPNREFIEYLHFLYAILDDTDLLSKVSSFDVQCVEALLNRMKSLLLKKEVEIVSLADLPQGAEFPKKAAKRLLQTPDLYSLYKKAYAHRELEVEKNLLLSAEGKASSVFADTKEQNGCCRIGQTKLFGANIKAFEKHKQAVQTVWYKNAKEILAKKAEIGLHLHMISTVVSADEVYSGKSLQRSHRDELWIWIPETEMGFELLRRFLSAFQNSPGLKDNPLELSFLGNSQPIFGPIFAESFVKTAAQSFSDGPPIAVVYYRAGSLNSRKAMVSPFLPEYKG